MGAILIEFTAQIVLTNLISMTCIKLLRTTLSVVNIDTNPVFPPEITSNNADIAYILCTPLICHI